MKKVIFVGVLFALISMCGYRQGTSKELNTYQIMDIQFKILDVSSKDF